MEINFKGKRALVTGAGRGIGREIVRLLVQLNAHVVAVSKTQANLDSLKSEFGEAVETVTVDLGNWSETQRKLAPYAETVDFLVNNAAWAECVPLEKVTEEMLDKHWNINVKGVISVTQVVIQGMKKRKYGAIVNISSVAGLQGIQDHIAYGATKGALDNITKVMACELGPYGIRVNSVNPTVTWTEMALVGWSDKAKQDRLRAKVPLDRFAEPVEVARAVAYLLSDMSSMISAALVPVDGGQTSCCSA